MKRILLCFMSALFIAPMLPARAACPTQAIFLVLPDQIRGYARTANGTTSPCQVIVGANTQILNANSIAVSSHGFPRVSEFDESSVLVFSPSSNGNVAPYRSEGVGIPDDMSVATDGTYDYVMSVREYQSQIYITSGSPRGNFFVPGLFNTGSARYGGLAVTPQRNVVAAGYDASGQALVEVLGTPSSFTNPPVLQQIAGPATGLLPLDPNDGNHNPISVATDPTTGEIYVYTYNNATGARQVSVFAAGATGNVSPTRVISGSNTQLGTPGVLNNKIAVSSVGQLYVAEGVNQVLVFAAKANGNVAPVQVIVDPSAPTNPQGFSAGIAVRN